MSIKHIWTLVRFVGGLLIAAWIATVAGNAHHSFAAQYDANKPLTLKGVVTKMEWMNPHSRFYVDVKEQTGKTVNWNVELASPNVLLRQGWTRDALKVGDLVTVEGSQARDGSNMANAQRVTLADGRRVFAGSSGGDAVGSAIRNGNTTEGPKEQ
jgi:hypothetical protein